MHVLVAVDWHIIWLRIFHPNSVFARALWATIYISVISQVAGVVFGLVAALMRMSRLAPLRWLSGIYVWIFRGTPLLVQIFFIYTTLNLPIVHLGFWTIPSEALTGIVALSVNEGAYMREIIRAGIDSIDRGQMEAAKSIGMRYGLAMRRIVLPQAARVIVPPLGNEFNNMLKTTSLLVVISVPELFVIFSRKNASGSTVFHPLELFLAAAVWYLLLTTAWSIVQYFIERRLSRGVAGAAAQGPSMRERLVGFRLGSPHTGGR